MQRNNSTIKDIAIYGMGGLGREVACMIREINEVEPIWNFIGFFDDGDPTAMTASSNGKLLGNIDTLNNWPTELHVVLCFGAPRVIESVHNKIVNPKVKFPNLIHPDFHIGDKATFSIGIGNVITTGCAVTCNVTIGNFNLLNTKVGMGHDSKLGNFNVLMPRTNICGEVHIGNRNLFGSNCFIKQQLKVPDDVTVGPLSVLLTKPTSGNTYIGNPAKKFKF
jgi:sugar O-acyltransferase (sialic acid O-acetyltransferase NeuD family)